MLEKFLYPGLSDRRINDGTSAFCRDEGIDEKYLRFCFSQDIKRERKISTQRVLRIFAAIAGTIIFALFVLSMK